MRVGSSLEQERLKSGRLPRCFAGRCRFCKSSRRLCLRMLLLPSFYSMLLLVHAQRPPVRSEGPGRGRLPCYRATNLSPRSRFCLRVLRFFLVSVGAQHLPLRFDHWLRSGNSRLRNRDPLQHPCVSVLLCHEMLNPRAGFRRDRCRGRRSPLGPRSVRRKVMWTQRTDRWPSRLCEGLAWGQHVVLPIRNVSFQCQEPSRLATKPSGIQFY